MGVCMGYETLTLERAGHVAILTLNRPDKLNAFDRQLAGEYHAALDRGGDGSSQTSGRWC